MIRKQETITSFENSKWKSWQELLISKGIKSQKKFLLSGEKIIYEFLKNYQLYQKKGFHIQAEISTSKMPLLNLASNIPLYILGAELYKALDINQTRFPILYIGFDADFIENARPQQSSGSLDLATPLGDPKNLGALVRSAVAFGVRQVLLLPEACHPLHPQAIKSSAGAVFQCHFKKITPEFIQSIKPLLILDMKGQNLQSFLWPQQATLLVGEEGPGLKALQPFLTNENTQKIHIVTENVESLNAVVATSIALYAWKNSQ